MTWQQQYYQSRPGLSSTPGQITQTKEQFLQKYANAIDANGNFIPGKSNLWFDGENASSVYDNLIGKQQFSQSYGNPREGNTRMVDYFNPDVNMDSVEDPRPGGGWSSVKDVVLPTVGAAAALLGAQYFLGTGLGAGGASSGSSLLGAGEAVGAAGTGATTSAVTGGGSVVGTELGLLGAGEATAAAGATAAGSAASPYALTAGGGGGGLTASTLGAEGYALTGAGAAPGLSAMASTSAIPGAALTSGGAGLASMGGGTGLTVGGAGAKTMGFTDYLTGAGKFLADNKWAGQLAGGLLGAAGGGDTTTSASEDPWGPAQQYLKDNLATNARMQQHYQANPFSNEQKQAYQGIFDANANGLANAGNYAQIANNFMGSNRGQMAAMPTLLSGTKAPQIDWTKYQNIGLLGGG